jgi:hypothetical protein
LFGGKGVGGGGGGGWIWIFSSWRNFFNLNLKKKKKEKKTQKFKIETALSKANGLNQKLPPVSPREGGFSRIPIANTVPLSYF